MKIGIDVDLTVVDSLQAWIEWHNEQVTEKEHVNKSNLHGHSVETLMSDSVDSLSFWDYPTLYDNLVPIPGASAAVFRLKEDGHEIVFVTASKHGHMKSKELFLEKYFGGAYECVIHTSHKKHIDLDVMIDDHPEVLNDIADRASKTVPIMYGCSLNEAYIGLPYERFDNWGDIYLYIKELNDKCAV